MKPFDGFDAMFCSGGTEFFVPLPSLANKLEGGLWTQALGQFPQNIPPQNARTAVKVSKNDLRNQP